MDDLVGRPKAKINAAEMERRREGVHQADANNRIKGQFSPPRRRGILRCLHHRRD